MDAPVSIAQRKDDPSLTYINKGQYYTLRGRYTGSGSGDQPARTSLYLLFQGEQKPRERDGYWRYWRDHQPSVAARAMSVGIWPLIGKYGPSPAKESYITSLRGADPGVCVGIKDVTQAGFNGVEFTWTPNAGCVVRLCVNCLSTDFTPQKGVKGIPLQLQVGCMSAARKPWKG